MKRIQTILCGLLLCLFGAGKGLLYGQEVTQLSGAISSDTTLELTSSPYLVTRSVLVREGVKLTVEPGVVVKFDSEASLQVFGELLARGTASDGITFTSAQDSKAAGDWGQIAFYDSSVDATFDGDDNYASAPSQTWAMYLGLVELLIAKGGDVDVKNSEGVNKLEPGKAINQRSQILLNEACGKGDLEAVKAEIKKGAKVEARDSEKRTPIFYAVKSENIDLVKYLVDECDAKIDVVDSENITLLHIAAQVGSKSIVSFLIEKGLDVNAKAVTSSYELINEQMDRKAVGEYFPEWSKTGKSPLHFAAESGNEEVVRLLLEAGADLDYVTAGKSPLDLASPYPEVVFLLKSSSARSSRELRFNREIFEPVIEVLDENYSNQSPHAEVFENIKTNLKLIDYSKHPVFYYVSKNSWNVMENVVNAEGDKARKAVNGITPLLFTILKGNKRIAEILISNGSDPAYLIHEDYSLLRLAQALKDNELTELLASSLKNPAQKKQDE